MRRMMLAFGLMAVPALFAGPKPIDYVVNARSSVMTIAMRDDVQWTHEQNGPSVRITIAGRASDFIVKRMAYTFRDGMVKTFSMAPVHPDTEQVHITLRRDQTVTVRQHPETKRLIIECLNAGAASVSAPAARAPKKSAPAVVPPVQIAAIAREGSPAVSAPLPSAPVTARTADSMNVSAMLLLFVSVVITAVGGGAVAYILLRRRPLLRRTERPAPAPDAVPAPPAAPKSLQRSPLPDEDAPAFEKAVEYAEQYLRTQGEYELQQRLEQLNRSSYNRKLEHTVSAAPKRGNSAAAAEKLGISVGEVELAARLHRLQRDHVTENV